MWLQHGCVNAALEKPNFYLKTDVNFCARLKEDLKTALLNALDLSKVAVFKNLA